MDLMRAFAVYLEPRSAFHLGERGIGYEGTSEFVRADTLFGALCTAWGALYGEDAVAAELLPPRPVPETWEPPFLLSSAFPYAGTTRFYPAPLLDPPGLGPVGRAKEVRWVSESLFRAWIRQTPLEEPKLLHGGSVALTHAEARTLAGQLKDRQLETAPESVRLWARERVPRVTLDPLSQASQIWHFGRVRFREGCGLWFAVRCLRVELERVRGAVRLLGDLGLGGDRSAGHGLFSARWEPFEEAHAAGTSGWSVTLSPVYPAPHQLATLLAPGCRYQLVLRTGWIGGAFATPYRRKAVRMVAEGSVLGGGPDRVWGWIADVTPENLPEPIHPVYRWGYAFPVPCEVRPP